MTKCRRPRNIFRYLFVNFLLFGSIWKHLEANCFRYFGPLFRQQCFVLLYWYSLCLTGEIVTQSASSHKSAKTEKLPNASKMVLGLKRFWKHLETCLDCFRWLFVFTVSKRSNKIAKTVVSFQIAKNSEQMFLGLRHLVTPCDMK